MKIAVYQGDCAGMTPDDRLARLDQVLGTHDCDLLVCPELFLNGYHCPDRAVEDGLTPKGPVIAALSQLAVRHSSAVISGFAERDGAKSFNSAVCIDKNGKMLARHRKLVLPPGFERDVFVAGNGLTFFDVKGFRVCILICYDAEFPESVRAAAAGGAQLVVVPTALGKQWRQVALQVMPSRAFENGVWIAYANHAGHENGLDYAGLSCVLTPYGKDAARAGTGDEVIGCEIDQAAVGQAQQRLQYLSVVDDLTDRLA